MAQLVEVGLAHSDALLDCLEVGLVLVVLLVPLRRHLLQFYYLLLEVLCVPSDLGRAEEQLGDIEDTGD